MAVVVVVGAQWGDEGKGKVVDLLARRADVVARYGGGANAGHTLVIDGRQLVTHLIPSGVLHPGKKCVLGDGMVIDPATLLEEIAACRERGLLPADELLISDRAHVILPFHKMLEGLREEHASARGKAIGTTRRGIGPAYEAKAARRGIRMGDLLRADRLRRLMAQNMEELAPLVRHYGGEMLSEADIETQVTDALRAGEALAAHIGNAGVYLDRAIRDGSNVLFEGAQGALLDVDHGTYPYVTSSTTTAAGACTGCGVGPTRIDQVVGISKAYCTRVGAGPFPSELHGEAGGGLREAGGEFGATTGRPRRCGWLDLPALRHAVRINGMTGLALTKLDVLEGRGEVSVCVSYKLDGREIEDFPVDADDVGRVEPVFATYPGWDGATSTARSLDDLPAPARAYVSSIEKLVGVPFSLVSVGADRVETIEIRDPFQP